jgi:REP element-mobilizing transposase RayT
MERYRFHADGSLFYVTFSVVGWLPVFVSEPAFKIVTESLNFCNRQKGLRTNAYVIMPTHLHVICFHESFQAKALESVLTDFRKFTGRQLAEYCTTHLPACFTSVFKQQAGDDRERRFWQPARHPVQIEAEQFWQAKLDYMHANPCRKGLVAQPEHWRFSSASYWLQGGSVENDVALTGLEW